MRFVVRKEVPKWNANLVKTAGFLLNPEQKQRLPKNSVGTFGPIKNVAVISAKVYYIQACRVFFWLEK